MTACVSGFCTDRACFVYGGDLVTSSNLLSCQHHTLRGKRLSLCPQLSVARRSQAGAGAACPPPSSMLDFWLPGFQQVLCKGENWLPLSWPDLTWVLCLLTVTLNREYSRHWGSGKPVKVHFHVVINLVFPNTGVINSAIWFRVKGKDHLLLAVDECLLWLRSILCPLLTLTLV